jgi:hypothetical protein
MLYTITCFLITCAELYAVLRHNVIVRSYVSNRTFRTQSIV